MVETKDLIDCLEGKKVGLDMHGGGTKTRLMAQPLAVHGQWEGEPTNRNSNQWHIASACEGEDRVKVQPENVNV